MKTIDTTIPWIPDRFTLESNQDLGKLTWSPKEVTLYVAPKQKESSVVGEELLKDVEKRKPLNSAVLKYLYDNPKEIPEEWKKYFGVYFWGTILRGPSGFRCVLCLVWDEGRWDWFCFWLGGVWDESSPSAVLASPLNSDTLPSSETLALETRVANLEETVKRLTTISY